MRGNMTQPEPKTLSRISALHETARRAFRIGAQEARRVLTAPGIHPDDRRITMDAGVLEHATRDMPRASLGFLSGAEYDTGQTIRSYARLGYRQTIQENTEEDWSQHSGKESARPARPPGPPTGPEPST